MPQAIIHIPEDISIKIDELAKELNISKHDLIIKILIDFDYKKIKGGK